MQDCISLAELFSAYYKLKWPEGGHVKVNTERTTLDLSGMKFFLNLKTTIASNIIVAVVSTLLGMDMVKDIVATFVLSWSCASSWNCFQLLTIWTPWYSEISITNFTTVTGSCWTSQLWCLPTSRISHFTIRKTFPGINKPSKNEHKLKSVNPCLRGFWCGNIHGI